MGRPLRTHLDLLRPNIATRVHMSQDSQKLNYDRKPKSRSFSVEDSVFASNNDSPWIPGTVAVKLGELTYQVQFDNGRMVRRHIDQILPRHLKMPVPSPEEIVIPNEAPFLLDNTTTTVNSEPEPVLRRSSRVRHPPDLYTA